MTRRVVVWNVERLFHPSGSPLSRSVGAPDDWTPATYARKVDRVAAVLNQVCPGGPPVLLLLNEVENAAVVRDLLAAAGWSALVEVDVPGEQIEGYDVATVFDPAALAASPAQSYNIHNRYSTRDLLVASFRTASGDDLHVLNNHWPSRTISDAAMLRLGAADYCSRIVERLLKFDKVDLVDSAGRPRLASDDELSARWNRHVIVGGDFNDDPFDASIPHLVDSTPSIDRVRYAPRWPRSSGKSGIASYLQMRPRLYNPTWELIAPHAPGPGGTYRHDGEWHWLDQVLVSRGLVVDDGSSYVPASVTVHRPASVSEGGRRVPLAGRGGVPRGFTANGGVSDHFPLTFDLAVG